MGPIPLRPPNNVPQGSGGTTIGVRVTIKIRDDSSGGDPGGYAGLNSPVLAAVFVVFGVFSLTLLSIFGRRLVEANRRQRRGQGMMQRTDSENGRTEEDYILLASMLGLNVGQIRGRMSRLHFLGDKPTLWDIHANLLGAERPSCWGDIVPIAVKSMLSEEERHCVRDAIHLAPPSTPRHSTDRLMRFHRRQRTPTEPDAGGTTQEERHRTVLPHKHLQVVVAIAMPRRPGQRGTRDRTVNYSFGVHEVPWNGDA